MMVALVNGTLDFSSVYLATGVLPWVDEGAATHHEFFTPDLQFIEKKILSDTPHSIGTSMIFIDGIYYFVTATAVRGDVIVMKYDQDWNYLGMKELTKQGNWPEGVAFVCILSGSQPTPQLLTSAVHSPRRF
jgi:signal peptidase I